MKLEDVAYYSKSAKYSPVFSTRVPNWVVLFVKKYKIDKKKLVTMACEEIAKNSGISLNELKKVSHEEDEG